MAKKTIAIFTTTEGHKSIAEAIQAGLAADYNIEIFYEVDDLFYSYYIFYKYAPFLFVTPFIVGTNPAILKMAREWMKRRYYKKIAAFVEKVKPDALINVFWMYEGSLEKIAINQQLPLINVIADPLSFHPTSIGNPPAVNLVFDDQTEARLEHYSAKLKGEQIGWFVRPQFQPATDKKAVRRQLNLNPDHPVILVVTGSDGIENLLDLLEHLETPGAAEVIVACGNNQALRVKVETLLTKFRQHCPELHFTALPFTKEIHLYMQAADLVVGKAGPNMVFEAVATLAPFLATTHIAGQEDGNIEIIKNYHLGWVDEEPHSAAKLMTHLIEHPSELAACQSNLKKMAEYNQSAASKLRQILAQLLAAQ